MAPPSSHPVGEPGNNITHKLSSAEMAAGGNFAEIRFRPFLQCVGWQTGTFQPDQLSLVGIQYSRPVELTSFNQTFRKLETLDGTIR